jgi:hypothetical protein
MKYQVMVISGKKTIRLEMFDTEEEASQYINDIRNNEDKYGIDIIEDRNAEVVEPDVYDEWVDNQLEDYFKNLKEEI